MLTNAKAAANESNRMFLHMRSMAEGLYSSVREIGPSRPREKTRSCLPCRLWLFTKGNKTIAKEKESTMHRSATSVATQGTFNSTAEHRCTMHDTTQEPWHQQLQEPRVQPIYGQAALPALRQSSSQAAPREYDLISPYWIFHRRNYEYDRKHGTTQSKRNHD